MADTLQSEIVTPVKLMLSQPTELGDRDDPPADQGDPPISDVCRRHALH